MTVAIATLADFNSVPMDRSSSVVLWLKYRGVWRGSHA